MNTFFLKIQNHMGKNFQKRERKQEASHRKQWKQLPRKKSIDSKNADFLLL